LFKRREEDQFPTRFWGYDTTKGADSLEEGESFVVAYVENSNPKGDKPIKGARMFIKADEKSAAFAAQKNKQQPLLSDGVPSEEEVKVFLEEYLSAEDEPTLHDFVLTYFKNKRETEFDLVVKVGRESIGKESEN
jgi:hypothetical protein